MIPTVNLLLTISILHPMFQQLLQHHTKYGHLLGNAHNPSVPVTTTPSVPSVPVPGTRYQHQHQQQYQSDYLKFHRLPCIQHINLLLYNIPLHRGEDTIHQHHHQCHSPKTPISHSHLQSFNHLHHALSKRNFHFVLSNQRTPNHRTSPNSKIKLQSTIIGRSGASSHLHRPGTHYWLPEMQLVSHSTSKCHHSNKGPYSSSHQVPYLQVRLAVEEQPTQHINHNQKL